MKTIAVIGKNFGDEGKGLVTASLSSNSAKCLVIRHNGGGQAGHTVENTLKGTGFIHHQIGSGAEYGADTLIAETFYPDLYQLGKEMRDFGKIYGLYPKIYAESDAKITTVDDVLLNMAIETARGKERHGSCGMGINECSERNSAGYSITLKEATETTARNLSEKLKYIRKEYTLPRAKMYRIDETNPYYELLESDDVIENYADEALRNLSFVKIIHADKNLLEKYDTVIFENGQGLLLDKNCKKYAPHLTASRTGLTEPLRFLQKRNMKLDEAIYVTRTYVTRHGAGPLPCECTREELGHVEKDMTNEPNEWQGQIRYARHESTGSFLGPLLEDVKNAGILPSLAVTHLDETDGKMLFQCEDIPFDTFNAQIKRYFRNIYTSHSRNGLD